MADAPIDSNSRQGLIAASSADGITPVRVYANPSTHRLLVESTTGVSGPGSSTDNAIARFDGTTGETIQNSVVIVADTGNVTGVGSIDATSYKVGGIAGTTGSFTTVDLKTVTVINGIITDIS